MKTITINQPINIYTPWPKCPFDNDYCEPNIIFGKRKDDLDCYNCKYWKDNYDKVLNNGICRSINDKDSNYHKIFNKVKKDGGKWIKIENDFGFLIGASTTIEDYYWIYMDSDRKIHFSSCVGGYTVLEDDEIPQNLSILSYMRKHDKKIIKEKIDNYIKDLKYDKIITDIYY